METRNAFLDSRQPQIFLLVAARLHLKTSHLAKHFANMDAGAKLNDQRRSFQVSVEPRRTTAETAKARGRVSASGAFFSTG
jgi:hypothetical protein